MTAAQAWQLIVGINHCREDSDPRFITKAADVKLRSFTTKVWLSIHVQSLRPVSVTWALQANMQSIDLCGHGG